MFSNVCCFIIYVCLNFQRKTRMKLRWKINILAYRWHTLTYLLACCSKEYCRMLIVIKQTFQHIIEFNKTIEPSTRTKAVVNWNGLTQV